MSLLFKSVSACDGGFKHQDGYMKTHRYEFTFKDNNGKVYKLKCDGLNKDEAYNTLVWNFKRGMSQSEFLNKYYWVISGWESTRDLVDAHSLKLV